MYLESETLTRYRCNYSRDFTSLRRGSLTLLSESAGAYKRFQEALLVEWKMSFFSFNSSDGKSVEISTLQRKVFYSLSILDYGVRPGTTVHEATLVCPLQPF